MTSTGRWTASPACSATAERIGAHVTCAEANVIAYALAASRHTDAAIVWLDAHAVTDEEVDVHGAVPAARSMTVRGRTRRPSTS